MVPRNSWMPKTFPMGMQLENEVILVSFRSRTDTGNNVSTSTSICKNHKATPPSFLLIPKVFLEHEQKPG